MANSYDLYVHPVPPPSDGASFAPIRAEYLDTLDSLSTSASFNTSTCSTLTLLRSHPTAPSAETPSAETPSAAASTLVLIPFPPSLIDLYTATPATNSSTDLFNELFSFRPPFPTAPTPTAPTAPTSFNLILPSARSIPPQLLLTFPSSTAAVAFTTLVIEYAPPPPPSPGHSQTGRAHLCTPIPIKTVHQTSPPPIVPQHIISQQPTTMLQGTMGSLSISPVPSSLPPASLPLCSPCLHLLATSSSPSPTVPTLTCSENCGILYQLNLHEEALDATCAFSRYGFQWFGVECVACEAVQPEPPFAASTSLTLEARSPLPPPPAPPTCSDCGTSTFLWICLTCGKTGCGRYTTERHAYAHYRETGHVVAIEVGSGRCWDYEKDAFVERGGWRECDRRNTLGSQALAEPAAGGKKVNDMTAEVREVFDSQLTSALEEQRSWWEVELARSEREDAEKRLQKGENVEQDSIRRSILSMDEAIQEMNGEIVSSQKEESILRKISKTLLMRKGETDAKVSQVTSETERLREDLRIRVEDLETQIRDLTAYIDMQHKIQESGEECGKDGKVLFTTGGKEDSPTPKRGGKKGKKNRKG